MQEQINMSTIELTEAELAGMRGGCYDECYHPQPECYHPQPECYHPSCSEFEIDVKVRISYGHTYCW